MSGAGKLATAAGIGVALALVASPHHHHHGHEHTTLASAAGPVTSSGNEQLGMAMAAARGWTGGQADCLNWLWTRESNWSNTAENTTSGAYGIAQALGHGPTNQYPAGPANPPASDARTQIRWGLRYIRGRYGDPCSAWAHETNAGWY